MKKKEVIALLTLVTSLTMTACSFQFSTPENVTTQVPDQITTFSVDMAEELSNIIDNTDITNDEELEKLVDEVTQWADDLVEENENLGEFQKAKLVRVVDGDTIVVDIEGEEYKVRLIGINTPESVASENYLEKTGKENTKEGQDASQYVKDLLANVETIYLQSDVSDTDLYDRLLRYVWLELPEDANNIDEISEKMLNGILVLDGVAEPARYEPDVLYAEEFEYLDELEEENR